MELPGNTPGLGRSGDLAFPLKARQPLTRNDFGVVIYAEIKDPPSPTLRSPASLPVRRHP